MENKTVLLFDFDGTIVDSMTVIKTILNDLAPKYGYKNLEDNDIELLRGKSPREILTFVNLSFLKIPFIARDLKKAFRENLQNVPLVAGMKETLQTLSRQGVLFGIITSNGKENVETFLKLNGIHTVEFVYGDVGLFGKARVIERALRENSIDKQNAVYVGDELRDIDAAKKVGIKIISVTWGFNSSEALKNASPNYLVHNPNEIVQIIVQ